MKYISVCSGIEAATVAWRPLGWEALAFAEIEPFPCAVLEHYYHEVPNLGDITKVDWRKYAGEVDLVVGGTPCQSFSVAGKREGLDGASGLVREYFRLLSEVRPRWFVWENVPGSLSSGNGRDFAFILGQWQKLGYHVAWRVLDAQYFGVPQRRRRVFAVGHLGGWQYPAAVLFEPESLRGNTAPRRKARKENSRCAEAGAGKAGRGTVSGKDIFPTLQANCGSKLWLGNQEAFSGDYFIREEMKTLVTQYGDKAGTLTARHDSSPCTDRGQNIVYGVTTKGNGDVFLSEERHTAISAGGGMPGQGYPAVFCIAGNTIDRQVQNGGNGAGFQPEISYTLNTVDRHAVCSFEPGIASRCGGHVYEGVAPTLRAEPGDNAPAVCCAPVAPTIGASGPPYSRPGNERVETEALVFRDTTDCLTAAYGTKWNGNASAENGSLFALNSALVRRLTPTECERLQGFPDGYTDVEFKGKPAPDTARYKALGNSMAVPCMRWIGERIQIMEEECQ